MKKFVIKERVEYEMSLTPEEYKELKYGNKLDWNQLSKNKGIFVAVQRVFRVQKICNKLIREIEIL